VGKLFGFLKKTFIKGSCFMVLDYKEGITMKKEIIVIISSIFLIAIILFAAPVINKITGNSFMFSSF